MRKVKDSSLIKKGIREFGDNSLSIFGIFLILSLLLLLPFSAYISKVILGIWNQAPDWLIVSTAFILSLLFIIIAFFMRELHRLAFERLLRTTQDTERLYKKELKAIGNIDQIVHSSQKIYKIIGKLRFYNHFIPKYTLGKNKEIFEAYIHGLSAMALKTLNNLKSDLSVRLMEEKIALESKKEEIIQNIKGSTELKRVSELQKLRLDRQIEQFDELQRILAIK